MTTVCTDDNRIAVRSCFTERLGVAPPVFSEAAREVFP